MDASDGELKARLDGTGGGLLLVAALHGALGTLAGEALTGEALSALARHVYVCVGGGTVSVARCIVPAFWSMNGVLSVFSSCVSNFEVIWAE